MSARALMIPAWTETVAALKAEEGVRVFQKCTACEREEMVDLDALIERFGPLYSLWNRHPPCTSPDCEGRLWYRAQPRNYFHRILSEAPDGLVAPLHERWKASLPADAREDFPLVPMMTAAAMIVRVGCGRCGLSATLTAADVSAWGPRTSMADLGRRLACSVGCEIALEMTPKTAL